MVKNLDMHGVKEQLAEILKDEYLMHKKMIGYGFHGSVYHVTDDIVAKVTNGHSGSLKREHQIACDLQAEDSPVPRVLAFDKVDGYEVIFMEYIERTTAMLDEEVEGFHNNYGHKNIKGKHRRALFEVLCLGYLPLDAQDQNIIVEEDTDRVVMIDFMLWINTPISLLRKFYNKQKIKYAESKLENVGFEKW